MAEFTNMPGTTKEIRDGVVTAFDALSNWSDEIEKVNERCLKKVLDQTSTVARSMGWPDQAIRMMRERLENASKADANHRPDHGRLEAAAQVTDCTYGHPA